MLKQLKKANIISKNVPEQNYREASSYLTLNRVPFGTYLIKEGEIPKALFYLSKGIVKKVF